MLFEKLSYVPRLSGLPPTQGLSGAQGRAKLKRRRPSTFNLPLLLVPARRPHINIG